MGPGGGDEPIHPKTEEAQHMTAYSGRCELCPRICVWINCPTHGWWAHREDPKDVWAVADHEPQISWQPIERLNDRGEWETA
jgi:hypothetical protein